MRLLALAFNRSLKSLGNAANVVENIPDFGAVFTLKDKFLINPNGVGVASTVCLEVTKDSA